MNLIFIYGPPAVGKLTVANELEKLTGYKNFHGHRSLDAVHDIFEFGNKSAVEIVKKFRESVLEGAAVEGLPGLIFTYVYHAGDPWIQHMVERIEHHGGRICFVQLTAPEEILIQRLTFPSRMKNSKLKDPDVFRKLLIDYNLTAKIDQPNNLTIDTTKTSPAESAEKIVEYFHLYISF